MAIHMFQQLIDTLKKSPKRIVFTEGTDARILEASARLLAGTWLAPILIGNEAEVKAAAEEVGFNIRGAEIIDPATYPDMDKMVEEMVALRRGKMTADECRAALMKGNYFGTMLVKMGVADCLLGGATYSTADTVRPALQLIKRAWATTLCWPWATAPSTSTLRRTSWWRSAWSAPSAPKPSALTPRWPT